ncbi:Cation channel sperm-associated protein 2 [Oopsacas minuta]|uniref:Cation channel sperm-associated protein 2 n=1 Tax=Oopsacas minuta TaxID=111878 RepID=A0AAV7KAE6_9METZ|nr:Cation channel sperm-associated protein 2 [Oopsacas minuta]
MEPEFSEKEKNGKYAHLSRHTGFFRSSIIEEFQMLEGISDQGVVNPPIYNTSDILDKNIFNKIVQNTSQLIKFKTYVKDPGDGNQDKEKKSAHLGNRKTDKINHFTHSILSNPYFHKLGPSLLILNCITLAASGELEGFQAGTWHHAVRTSLDLMDLVIIVILSSEIVLKWLNNFQRFWYCWWNLFDLVIISLTTIPAVLSLIPSVPGSVLFEVTKYLRALRIIRSLKLISRVSGLKIIVLTLLEAFQSMAFIMVLLFAVAYIFAIVAVSLFQPTSQVEETEYFAAYYRSFSTLHDAILTLFQLFTLDQWYRVYRAAASVIDPNMRVVLMIYVILWIWLGAFIFKNIIVGIIVENFEVISAQLTNENNKEAQQQTNKRILSAWNNQLCDTDSESSSTFEDSSPNHQHKESTVSESSPSRIPGYSSSSLTDIHQECQGWQAAVHEYAKTLGMDPDNVLWSRENLFNYYQVMEELFENLEEAKQLERILGEVIIKLFDKTSKDIK